MVAWNIMDVKKCMQYLLATEMFDSWQLAEAKIVTCVRYDIDGHLTADYLSEEERKQEGMDTGDCIPYKRIRPFCYEVIKGKRVPKSFRVVLLCPTEAVSDFLRQRQLEDTPEHIANLSLIFSYMEGKLIVTAGATLCTFSMDKSLETEWGLHVKDLFQKMEIALEKIG